MVGNKQARLGVPSRHQDLVHSEAAEPWRLPIGTPTNGPASGKGTGQLPIARGPKGDLGPSGSSRAREHRQKNCPQALFRYETLSLGNTTRWVWRHDWTMTLPTPLVTGMLRMRLDVFPVTHKLKDWWKMDSRACVVWDSGREETLAHFLLGCEALPNTREVTTLIPSHSTLHINVAPGNILANTVGKVFRRIREEQLSSEEISQVVIGETVKKEGREGTESVVRWEMLVPPKLVPCGRG